MPSPSEEDTQDLLLSCRFGDINDVQSFVASFHQNELNIVLDDNGNSVLHMASANGHADLLAYLLPRVNPTLLAHRNHAGSTALHWAALNHHLDTAQALVQFQDGPGINLIDIKNNAGRSPLAEAELAGWDEGARWFVQVMNLDDIKEEEVTDASPVDPSDEIEVEIQDADGQIARMTINPTTPASDPVQPP